MRDGTRQHLRMGQRAQPVAGPLLRQGMVGLRHVPLPPGRAVREQPDHGGLDVRAGDATAAGNPAHAGRPPGDGPGRLHHEAQFDGIEPAWTVSVIRDGAGRIPLHGLIDEEEELVADAIDGFAAEWVFSCYAKSPDRFTARIEDDWQLYAFVWVIAHSGAGAGRSARHA